MKLKRQFWLWLLLSALCLAIAFFLDAASQQWVMRHQTHSGKIFMRAISRWGDWPPHVALGLACAALAYLLGKRDWLAIFTAMLIGCAVVGAINPALKFLTGRARPSVVEKVGWNGPSLNPKYHAFASGHTAASTAFFGVLFFARRRIGALFLPIPLIIGGARVYLNAHHLSDVIGGAILGAWSAFFVWEYFQQRFEIARN